MKARFFKLVILLSAFVILSHLAIKSYDLVIALTNGGPGQSTWVPGYYTIDALAKKQNLGLASAAAVTSPDACSATTFADHAAASTDAASLRLFSRADADGGATAAVAFRPATSDAIAPAAASVDAGATDRSETASCAGARSGMTTASGWTTALSVLANGLLSAAADADVLRGGDSTGAGIGADSFFCNDGAKSCSRGNIWTRTNASPATVAATASGCHCSSQFLG